MNDFRQKRIGFWIAFVAIAVAVVVLLVPHASNATDQQTWLALLPVYFVGLLAPLSLEPLLPVLTVEHFPEVPALAPAFQRPPPVRA